MDERTKAVMIDRFGLTGVSMLAMLLVLLWGPGERFERQDLHAAVLALAAGTVLTLLGLHALAFRREYVLMYRAWRTRYRWYRVVSLGAENSLGEITAQGWVVLIAGVIFLVGGLVAVFS